MNLKNILQSGYNFQDYEYELSLRYILFNSLLIFNTFLVSVATYTRLENLQYINAAVDIVYIIVGIISFFIARKSKKYFNALVYFVIFFSYSIVTLSFSTGHNPIAGVSWYFILLMTVIFLKGAKIGIFVFTLSIISIILMTSKLHNNSSVEIVQGIIPFFAALMFMYFFEQRNNNLKKRLEMQKKEYQHQAQYDDLTGIANRGLFIDRLSHALVVAKRSNTQVAVIFIDLDHFKEINDSFGHCAGDVVLKEVAKRLKSKIRESDTIARVGGDEYAAIIDSFDSVEVLKNILGKILNTMNEPFIFENNKLKVTLSLGVTIYPEDGDKTDILLRNADVAMYKAKANGKNGYSFYNTNL